jgi:hypothetical protein
MQRARHNGCLVLDLFVCLYEFRCCVFLVVFFFWHAYVFTYLQAQNRQIQLPEVEQEKKALSLSHLLWQ